MATEPLPGVRRFPASETVLNLKPIDRFAELLSQGLTTTQIRGRMRLSKGQAAGYLKRIRDGLGWQAQ